MLVNEVGSSGGHWTLPLGSSFHPKPQRLFTEHYSDGLPGSDRRLYYLTIFHVQIECDHYLGIITTNKNLQCLNKVMKCIN
jgi:hypothetical protein